VTIRDTGVDITPEHLPHVFDHSSRVAKARSRLEGRTRPSLSIARSIVLAHAGRRELASDRGYGTICTVRLSAEAKS
jgi:signal transduction histidine kinase